MPDVQFLLDLSLEAVAGDIGPDATWIGLFGHSFRGWTVPAMHELAMRGVVVLDETLPA